MSIISQGQKEKLGQDFKHREINVGTAYTGSVLDKVMRTPMSHQWQVSLPTPGMKQVYSYEQNEPMGLPAQS